MAMSQIPTLTANIWQTSSWQIYPPPLSAHFTDSYSKSSYLDNEVLVDPPSSLYLKWQFHRFLLWELIFGRQGLRRSSLSNGNVTDSYCEGSYLAHHVFRSRQTYPWMVISQIPTPRAHNWQSRSWQIFHPHQTVISQIPSLRAHIWQTRSWQIFQPQSPTVILQIPTLRVHIWHTQS